VAVFSLSSCFDQEEYQVDHCLLDFVYQDLSIEKNQIEKYQPLGRLVLTRKIEYLLFKKCEESG